MLRATDNNEMLTGKLVANTTGQVSQEKTRGSFRLTGHTMQVNS